jgi:ParB family chromosome partitioning protein
MINSEAIFGEGASLPKIFPAPVAGLRPNPDQPRQVFNEETLQELAGSIERHGLLQPIIVMVDPKNRRDGYIIIAGERRYRAHQLLKREIIPAILSSGDPAELALIENVQRDNLNPIEEAAAYAHLIELHGYSQSDLEKVVGKGRRTINEIIQLNTLPEEILSECRALGTPSNMTKTAFVAISRVKSRDEQLKLWEEAKGGELTTRQIETKKKVPKSVSRRSSAERVLNTGAQFTHQLKQLNHSDITDNATLALHLREIREQIDALLGEL